MSVLDPGFWSRDHEVEDLEADGVASLLGLLGLPAHGRLLEYLARECELCAVGKARESALTVMLVRGLTPYTAASRLDLGQDFLAKLREVHRLYLRCADALAGLTTFVLCPFCLSESVVSKGRVATYTSSGPAVRRRYRCLSCGRWTTRYPTWGPGWLSIPRAVRDYMLYLTNGGRYAKGRGSYSPRVVRYVEKVATLFRLAAGGDSARLLPGEGAVELDVAIPREGDVATSIGLYRSRQRLDPADPPELLSWSRAEVRLAPTTVVGRPRFRGVLRLGEVPRGRVMLVVTFAVRRPLVVRL